jgi:periplasmic protein TonB
VSGRGYDVADWLRWAASVVLVLGAHAAAAAIVVNYVDPVVPGTPSGAIFFELAPMTAAPENAQPDLAPGPVQPQIDGTPDVKPEQIADTPVEPVVAQEPVETQPPDKPVDVAVARIEPVEETIETPPEQKPQDQPLIEKVPEVTKPEVTATLPVAKPPPPKPKAKKASRPTQIATAPMPAPQVDTRAVAPSQGMPAPASTPS